MKPLALVVNAPGTNRGDDAAFALERAGAQPLQMWLGDLLADREPLRRAALAVFAGGFSYGDALGAGRMWSLALDVAPPDEAGNGEALGEQLRAFVTAGRPVIGICNGFQVLTRAGLLPGSLGHNDGSHDDSVGFLCEWVQLAAEPSSRCIWTADAAPLIDCPIAHGEGRYVHPDPDALTANGQVALRYVGANPNGSVADIAGVCDETGLVLGLMPHPENHAIARQHPRHRTRPDTADRLGLTLFTSAVARL